VLEVAALEFDDMVMTLVVLRVWCFVRLVPLVPRGKQTRPALGDEPGSLVVEVHDRKSQASRLTETDCAGRVDEILLVLDDISAVPVVAAAAAVRTEDDRMIFGIRGGGGCLQSPCRVESRLVETAAAAKYNADTQKDAADTIAVADGACFEFQEGIAKDELRYRLCCCE
jgi:hypothetical protein